jgi:hypothetical protein
MNLLAPLKKAFQPKPILSDCFNQPYIKDFELSAFTERKPFPWYNFQSLLTEETFQALYQDFPDLSFFAKHEGLVREYDQKPHDRYYLAYEKSIDCYQKAYREQSAQDAVAQAPEEKGVIHHEQLSQSWQNFITALQTDSDYQQFIRDLLGAKKFTTRFAWHVATAGHSVSPHVDGRDKIGTHIFYFNTSDDWQTEWGGSTLILDNKHGNAMNPEVSDFGKSEAVQVMDNRSFLFKNQPNAWHAVDILNCPPGVHRRIFNMIFEVPAKSKIRRKFFG